MILLVACFCVFAAVFTLAAVVDARQPERLTYRYRRVGGALNPYVVARRYRPSLEAPRVGVSERAARSY